MKSIILPRSSTHTNNPIRKHDTRKAYNLQAHEIIHESARMRGRYYSSSEGATQHTTPNYPPTPKPRSRSNDKKQLKLCREHKQLQQYSYSAPTETSARRRIYSYTHTNDSEPLNHDIQIVTTLTSSLSTLIYDDTTLHRRSQLLPHAYNSDISNHPTPQVLVPSHPWHLLRRFPGRLSSELPPQLSI